MFIYNAGSAGGTSAFLTLAFISSSSSAAYRIYGNAPNTDGLALLPWNGAGVTGYWIEYDRTLNSGTGGWFLDSFPGQFSTNPNASAAAYGLVPPSSGTGQDFLRDDATWQPIAGPSVCPRVTSQQTNSSTTPQSLSNLSVSVGPDGGSFVGRLVLFVNNSTAASGIKINLNGGSGLSFNYVEFGIVAAPVGATVGTVTSTAVGTSVTVTAFAATTDVCIVVECTFQVQSGGGGTIVPQFADNSGLGTATVRHRELIAMAKNFTTDYLDGKITAISLASNTGIRS